MAKSKGGLISNTMDAVAKRRVEMEEATGVQNVPVKKRAKKKKAYRKNNNKAYVPVKKTKSQKQEALDAARQRQAQRIASAKKKTTKYGTFE